MFQWAPASLHSCSRAFPGGGVEGLGQLCKKEGYSSIGNTNPSRRCQRPCVHPATPGTFHNLQSVTPHPISHDSPGPRNPANVAAGAPSWPPGPLIPMQRRIPAPRPAPTCHSTPGANPVQRQSASLHPIKVHTPSTNLQSANPNHPIKQTPQKHQHPPNVAASAPSCTPQPTDPNDAPQRRPRNQRRLAIEHSVRKPCPASKRKPSPNQGANPFHKLQSANRHHPIKPTPPKKTQKAPTKRRRQHPVMHPRNPLIPMHRRSAAPASSADLRTSASSAQLLRSPVHQTLKAQTLTQ